MVQRVIDLLGSPEIAIDDRHGPKLYSKFLKGLLAAPMARLDPSSSSSPIHKTRKPRISQTSGSTPSGISFAVDHPSPSTSASLSPPPRETALSFDTFAPVGPVDPFAPEFMGSSEAFHVGADDTTGLGMMSEFFQPPLPFDENILQSFQSLTDPSGWQDTTLPSMYTIASLFICKISYLCFLSEFRLADSLCTTIPTQFRHGPQPAGTPHLQ